MNLLKAFINILIKIGDPVVRFGKGIFYFLKKFRFPKIKFPGLKFPKFKFNFVKFRIKFPKFVLPKFKIKFPRWKLKKINENKRVNLPSLNKKRKIKWILPIGVAMLLILGSGWFYIKIIKDLPNVNLIYSPPNLSTKILDRNEKLLYKFYQNENRTWISLQQIPRDLIQATLAIEDKKFYKHYGLSLKGLVQAIIYNFKKEKQDNPRGGSTITQQLVKNVFFSSEKTLTRKIKEAILTLMVERKMTKDEILERYLNQVSYGGEAYGVEEASQKYFGKHVWELKTNESAYLAGLPAAPSSYSPYGNNPDLGYLRQKHVIEEMVSIGYLSQEKAEQLIKEKIEVKNNSKEIEAPHFVFYIRKLLEDQGYTNFERQGLVIKTSLDLDLQKKAQKIVKEEVEKNRNLKISNGGALVIDVKNGDILAMVGSVDYYSKEIDGKYNVTTALRQPGSSIKPINYLLALENNFSLASTISDSPISYQIEGQKPYTPQNYNGKYMGNVTLRTALASSLNIPSVKLLEKNGVDNMIDLAESMGINTWNDRKRFGLSLALGGGEIKMIELAGAYSVFANLGEKIEIKPILEIKNYLGENVYKKEINKKNIIKSEYAYLINSALSDNQARSPIFGLNSKLVIPNKTVAVKTGTTNSLRDNWCIGWTPSFLTVSWVGNNDGTPMSWVASGVSGATPIWNQLTNLILKEKANEEWPIPNGLVKKNICGREEWILAGSELKINCPTPKPSGTPAPELATN